MSAEEKGLLKKQIHKAYGELDDAICHENCLPKIDKILEVMWREFPDCPKITGYTLTMWKNEVDLWFLRWKGKHE